MRYAPFFLIFNAEVVRNLFSPLTSSFSETSGNRLLFVMKINFARTTSPIPVVVFQLSMLLFFSLDLDWWNGNINLKFQLVYNQQGYFFSTGQQRIYHILLLLLDNPKQVQAILQSRHPTLPCRHDDHK